MPSAPRALSIQVAGESDIAALASLRTAWTATATDAEFERRLSGRTAATATDAEFERRLSEWLAGEGDRRTIWLASLAGDSVGMASLFEYRRMPRPGRLDSRWGYVGNMFVREECRNRGIGAALLAALIAAAEKRSYARLVVSPTARSVPFYRRAGFVDADGQASELLLMRPRRVA